MGIVLAGVWFLSYVVKPTGEILKWGGLLFLWGAVFGILGLYAAPVALMFIGGMGYRNQSWN
jgi:hypothetical protein